MGLTRRERRGLIGIAFAAVITAATAYYYLHSAWALAIGLLLGVVFGAVKWGVKWLARRDRVGHWLRISNSR